MAIHPYYPLNAELPDFTPNEQSTWILVTSLCLSLLAILLSSWVAIQPKRRGLSRSDELIMLWFILCGTLHIGFEGYFVLNFKGLASKQTLLAQLWKEYALSDSRYLTQDVQVLCLETISAVRHVPASLASRVTNVVTAPSVERISGALCWKLGSVHAPFIFSTPCRTKTVWGPLSLLAAKWIAQRDARRHVLQTIVSVGHLYGVALYYSTSFVELYLVEKSYSRPEPLYFWGYFVGANFPWVVVPAYIIYRCLREINDTGRT